MPIDIEKAIGSAMQTVENEEERTRKERLANPQPIREDIFNGSIAKKDRTNEIFEALKGFFIILASLVVIIAVLMLISKLFSRGAYDRDDYLDHKAPDDYRISI